VLLVKRVPESINYSNIDMLVEIETFGNYW